jgi:hypothetical protein
MHPTKIYTRKPTLGLLRSQHISLWSTVLLLFKIVLYLIRHCWNEIWKNGVEREMTKLRENSRNRIRK